MAAIDDATATPSIFPVLELLFDILLWNSTSYEYLEVTDELRVKTTSYV